MIGPSDHVPGAGRSATSGAVPDAKPETTARVVEVVAGIVFDEAREHVLLALRKPEQHQGDRWEFPGGKLEPKEDIDAALARELDEEIGVRPRAWRHRTTLEHRYPEKTVRLHFVDVTAFDGEPVGREGQAVRWFGLDELDGLAFPDANRAVVDSLVTALRPGSGVPPPDRRKARTS